MRAFTLCAVLLTPGLVLADPEFSLSVGINHSQADAAYYGYPDILMLSHPRFSGQAPRVALGIAWSNKGSFEAGWAKFGTEQGTITLPGYVSPCAPICPGDEPNPPPGPPVVIPTEQTGSSAWLAYTPTLRRGRLDITAKIGVARVWRETDVSDNFFDFKESGTRLLLGGGATYWLNERMGASLDVETFDGVAKQIGIGITYSFGP